MTEQWATASTLARNLRFRVRDPSRPYFGRVDRLRHQSNSKTCRDFASQEVLILENLAVEQQGFLATYKRMLTGKGYAVRQVAMRRS